MTNSQFDKLRREAEITSVELADFLGVCRRYMLSVETGREPVTTSMISALNAMIKERTT